jgi:3-phenylpropionate/trans-cinnamate dioxygenase ferredoxin reductase subunit
VAVVKADLTACQGYANCVMAAPDYFDLGDDGVVIVVQAEIPDSDRAHVEAAVNSCPVSALRLGDT